MARSRGSNGDQVDGASPDPGEEDRLGRWVRAVVLRWTATGVSARDRASLFAELLHDLVVARARGTLARRLADTAPGPLADRLAARRSPSPVLDTDDAVRRPDSRRQHQ